jgi:hypothetical protein
MARSRLASLHATFRLPGVLAAGTLGMCLLALSGCASTSVNAQWSDPQFAGKSLRGAKVLVACRATDVTLRRVCEERLAAKLKQLGAQPLPASDQKAVDPDAAAQTPALLQEARTAGAAAVLRADLTPAAAAVNPGPSIGIGIGGFGGGYRGGGGVGFGVSAPVGAGTVETGYGASASLTDVASGQMMWSASATAPPSSNLNEQMDALATVLLDAARQAGFFPG